MKAFKGFRSNMMCKNKPEAQSNENYGASSSTGDYGASSSTGDYGASSSTGTCGASSSTGYKGVANAMNKTAVAVAWGYEAVAKGCKGAHLLLSDWEYIGDRYNNNTPIQPLNKDLWKLKGAKLVEVTGKEIKENTYYRCIDGKVVEVDMSGSPAN